MASALQRRKKKQEISCKLKRRKKSNLVEIMSMKICSLLVIGGYRMSYCHFWKLLVMKYLS